MSGITDFLDDSSSSDKTIVMAKEELTELVTKYTGAPSKFNPPPEIENIYNLDDFSDEDVSDQNQKKENHNGPDLVNWQSKFSMEDFCDDSNDYETVMERINQLQSEQFQGDSKHNVSKEVNTLITGDIIEKPNSNNFREENLYQSNGSSSEPSDWNAYDLKVEMNNIKNDIKMDLKLMKNSLLEVDEVSDDLNQEELIATGKPKKIRKACSSDRDLLQVEKELSKVARIKEREQKKIEKENQKQLKQALKVVENCTKPDKCIQYLTVDIEEGIFNSDYGKVIQGALKNSGYKFRASKQIIPKLISWTRKIPTIDNMLLHNVVQQEKHVLLLMEISEFLERIRDNTLISHIQSLLNLPQIEHLSIAVIELETYLNHLKNREKRDFISIILETDTGQSKILNHSNVTRKQIDRSLVELQIYCKNVYIRSVDKFEDIAIFVCECTKAVAQIAYKQARQKSYQQENELFSVNNRDCVKVDKDGHGLSRLWNQFLRMFPLASLETAEAITSVYPTMRSLMEKYEKCETSEEAELLLQNVIVRRAAGPLTGQRKIGPELSKKVYTFFTSEDNVLL